MGARGGMSNKGGPMTEPATEFRYDVFISYRHTPGDRKWAGWLLESLETYKVPTELVSQGARSGIDRVFRDEDELPSSADLGENITGTVDFEYNSDNTFNLEGEVEYVINEMLKGSVGIQVDQNFDPVLSGTITVEDVEIVPGRDLFSMEQELFKVNQTVMAGPVPVDINLGAGFGMKAAMEPVTFSTELEITDFRPKQMNMPNFRSRNPL